MTLKMYASRKRIPLEEVTVELKHNKIHAKDCENCDTVDGYVDIIDRALSFSGNLSDADTQRLLAIADKCPVHRTLLSETKINTKLVK